MKAKKKTVTVWVADDGSEHETAREAKIVDTICLLRSQGYGIGLMQYSLGEFITDLLTDPELVVIIKPRNQPQRSLI